MRPPQPDLLIGVVEAACSLCRQRRGDLPDVVSLRAGERQRHIPPPRRAGIRVRTAVGCRHDYRVSHPVAAEDPVSPHSARLSGNRPFTDTRSGRGRIRRVWRREQSERPPRRAGRCPCRSAHGRPRQLYLPSGLTIGAAHGRRPWSGSYASRNCDQGHTGHQPSPSSARLIIAYLGGEARERSASSKGDESHAQYQGPIALWPRAPGCSGQEHPMSTTAYAARSGPDSLPHDTGRDCDRV